jgi:hypothetical protein
MSTDALHVRPLAAARESGGVAAAASRITWKPLPALPFGSGKELRSALRERRPAVLVDLARDWPAMQNWTTGELAKRFGERRVQVYDASFGAPGRNYMGSIDRMRFADFLLETQERGRDLRMFLYNLSRQIPELLDDIRLPQVGLSFSRRFVFSFFGCRGSTTPLHYDIDMSDVLHTVITGRRRIRLFPPDAALALYQHPCTVRSYVDLDAPDYERFPALAQAQGFELILEAGQTLYMPAGWWHEFHYLEAGMGVSLRAPSPRWRDRRRGYANLLLKSPLDRLANRVAPATWYRWKAGCAERAARSAMESRARAADSRP